MMKTWTVAVVAGLCVHVGWAAEQTLVWPQFRGPNGSGIAEGQKPPVEFGPDKNVRWKAAVPKGLSSPILAGDKVVLTALDDGKLYTVAYDRTSGKEAWRAEAPATQLEAYHKTEGSPAASTSATDGQRIVSYFGSGGLFCYDLAGHELWKLEMPPARIAGDFGTGVSPIIAQGTVILVRDETKASKILALDVATGAVRWEGKRLSPASYCTPITWETATGPEVVAAGHARMIGYDLKTGREKWSVSGVPAACASSPVASEGTLFFAGGSTGPDDTEMQMPTYDSLLKDLDTDKDGTLSRAEAEKAFEGFFDNQDVNGDGKLSRDEWDSLIKFFSEGKNSAFALKSGGTGDVSETHVLWRKTKGLPYIPSAIAYRGQYVMVKDGGIVTSYDMQTGREVYQERIAAKGTYYASPVAANGHIYFASLNDGVVTVVKAGLDKPELAAQNPALGERIAATPAIASDVLYVRTDQHLYAFAAK